jgi:hypothetical protein
MMMVLLSMTMRTLLDAYSFLFGVEKASLRRMMFGFCFSLYAVRFYRHLVFLNGIDGDDFF